MVRVPVRRRSVRIRGDAIGHRTITTAGAPAVIVIHSALLVAVQSQPAATLTVKLRVAPVALTLADVGAIVGVHVAPACVTVNVWPAIVSVPVREVV